MFLYFQSIEDIKADDKDDDMITEAHGKQLEELEKELNDNGEMDKYLISILTIALFIVAGVSYMKTKRMDKRLAAMEEALKKMETRLEEFYH